MSAGIDPSAWIELVGAPKIAQLEKDVDGLKQAYWIAVGGGMVVGAVLAVLLPKLLHIAGPLA